MARTKVIVASKLTSWDDVNETLREIAERKSAIEAATGKYNEEEAIRRRALDELCNPHRDRIANLEEEMKLFCEEHRDDFGKKKTLEFSNGTVGFRTGTPKLKTLKGWTWQAVLDMIKRTAFANIWIRTKEDVNKEQIIIDYQQAQTDNEDLAKLGCEVVQDETFGYEAKVASEQASARGGQAAA